MKERRFSKLHLLLAGAVGAVLAAFLLCLALWLAVGPQGLTLLEAWGAVRTRFVGELDQKAAIDAAVEGLVTGLGDRWSYYLDAEGYAAQNQRRANTYVGVGVTVGYQDERGLLILEVTEGGPAWKAGLAAGEVITAVNGTPLAGEARYEGASYISGEEGTALTLTILSENGAERQVEMKRETVDREAVHSRMLEEQVGYIKTGQFLYQQRPAGGAGGPGAGGAGRQGADL